VSYTDWELSRDWDGPKCICGEGVSVPHQECMALLTPRQRRNYSKGRPLGDIEDEQ
jgi:hypothetical protein